MTRPHAVGDGLEVALLLLSGYSFHLYYNLIGHLSSLRGVDLGPWLVTPIDVRLPYMPVFVHFYQIAYFVPLAVMLVLITRLASDLPALRRIWVSFLALLFIHFSLYLLLPTSARTVRLPDDALGGGLLADLVRTQYRLATVWCAWPSLHVSACWFFYRQLAARFPSLGWAYLFWFAGMFLGTAAVKIHYVLDGATGLLIAESVHRLVFLRLERANACGWGGADPRSRRIRLASLATLVLLLLCCLPIAMVISGFEGPLYTIQF